MRKCFPLWWALLVLCALALIGPATSGTLVGSKHDMTGLNRRAGVEAMTGLAINDYRDPCIYCHVPSSVKGSPTAPGGSQILEWNRYLGNSADMQVYDSDSLRTKIQELGNESLLCLSCHDGTMAIDMVITKPDGWGMKNESPLHMRLDKGGGLDKCTQCHDGTTAHRMDAVVIGRNLMDDHPVGIVYPGLFDSHDFFPPNSEGRFRNGVRLFRNKVECASCHDVHNPDIVPFMRVEPKELCITCHNK